MWGVKGRYAADFCGLNAFSIGEEGRTGLDSAAPQDLSQSSVFLLPG